VWNLLGCYDLQQHFQILDFREQFRPEFIVLVLFANFAAQPGNMFLVRDFTICEKMQIVKACFGVGGFLTHTTEKTCPTPALFCEHFLKFNFVFQWDIPQCSDDLQFHCLHFLMAVVIILPQNSIKFQF
jgi:hypothetical protein